MGLKNHVLDHETRKSGLYPCYRLKINDFLSSFNQNIKIDIFTPVQQIPCYRKSRRGTLRLISWWRVTFMPWQTDTWTNISRLSASPQVRRMSGPVRHGRRHLAPPPPSPPPPCQPACCASPHPLQTQLWPHPWPLDLSWRSLPVTGLCPPFPPTSRLSGIQQQWGC